MRCLALLALSALSVIGWGQAPLTVRIIHTNDHHAHVEPFTIEGKSYGGYARQATVIRSLRQGSTNSLVLNAGDTFQGTMFFNTYQGLADLACMNVIGYDAACVGNHEFDLGPAPLIEFARNATFPILACNITSSDPEFTANIHPRIVVTVGGQKVGLIGAVTPETPSISSPGETITFIDLVSSIQREADALAKEGVNKIILISHIGYDVDKTIVPQLSGIDVVVGGHSHTPLGTPALPGWRPSEGPYPTFVLGKDGHRVPIVQAYEWSKVVGHVDLAFDASGDLTSVRDSGVTVIDDSVTPDPVVSSMVVAFREPIRARMASVVGEATASFGRGSGQNPMANGIADAMFEMSGLRTDVAFINAGGVRAGLDAGPITFGNALSVQPFGNKMTTVQLTGTELIAVLEEGVPDPDRTGGMLYPSMGFSYTVDFRQPAGKRVRDVTLNGQPLDPNATLTILVNNFTAAGGDAHVLLSKATGTRRETDLVDLDLLLAWFGKHKPTTPSTETRVQIIR